MSKINFKPGNMLYPIPAVMVTCGDINGKSNIITVAWTGTICTNPPMVYISVRPGRYSYNIIKNFIELLSDRNIFAHVREEKNDTGQYQFKKINNNEYLVLSDEKCIELRNSIIKYHKLISDIK